MDVGRPDPRYPPNATLQRLPGATWNIVLEMYWHLHHRDSGAMHLGERGQKRL